MGQCSLLGKEFSAEPQGRLAGETGQIHLCLTDEELESGLVSDSQTPQTQAGLKPALSDSTSPGFRTLEH